jgi:lysophospholipase L1-like esterase
LREGKGVTGDTSAEYSNERIAARNALAAAELARRNIPTVDLNAAVRGRPELHSDNVHLNGQGSQILATEICATVERLLSR